MKQHGPWKIVSSEVKYKNPWIEVREDKVIQPDGTPGIFGTLKIKPGVAVLPLDEKGFVYLVKEFHYAVGSTIETSVGGIDKGENPLQAAKRELKEELGITASSFTSLGKVEPLTTYVNCPVYLFLCRGLKFSKPTHDVNESITPLKVKFSKAVEMAMDGKIIAAAPLALILKANEYLKRHKR